MMIDTTKPSSVFTASYVYGSTNEEFVFACREQSMSTQSIKIRVNTVAAALYKADCYDAKKQYYHIEH